jgi:hypothetical protein
MFYIIALLYSVLYLSINTVLSFYHRDIWIRGTELVQHFPYWVVYIGIMSICSIVWFFHNVLISTWAYSQNSFYGSKPDGLGLKSAQARGCLCSIKCLFKDIWPLVVWPALTHSLSVISLFLFLFWELSKCAQPIGEIFPLHPFSFVVGVDSRLWSWQWDKVSNSKLRHRVPYPRFSLNTVFACAAARWKDSRLHIQKS